MNGPGLGIEMRTDLRVSARLCQVAGLLRMSGAELTDHLSRATADNPFLRLSLPALETGGAELPAAGDGLEAHVMGQVRTAGFAGAELRIALALVEALEPTGWLGTTLEEIATLTGAPEGQVSRVLARCQQLEPAGLFARDLAECLRLQLIDRARWTDATRAVLDNLPAMMEGGPEALARASGLPPAAVESVLADIRACDPKPGARFAAPDPGLERRPDLLVERAPTGWQVELDRSNLPRLSLSGPAAGPSLGRLEADARALVDAVRRRNQMTLRVARAAIAPQTGFLDHGASGLVPLRRRDVAERLGVHESTVSRVVQGLLVQTPRGVLELRQFFSRPIGSDRGDGVSRRMVQDRLRRMIEAENPVRPLSDGDLARRLAGSGTAISRRTVAKYRAGLGLPAGAERHPPGGP